MNHIEAVKVLRDALYTIVKRWDENVPSDCMSDEHLEARNALAATENIEQAEHVGEVRKFEFGDGTFAATVNGKLLQALPHGTKLYAAPQPAPQPAKADAWQQIETAPKDGTNILLINRKGNIASGLWQNLPRLSGWVLRGGNEPNVFFNDHHGPTHWMPLPAAPSTEKP